MINIGFILAAFLCAALPVFSQTSAPATAVRSFYNAERTAPQTFNKKNLELRKRWISSGLYKRFSNELKREAAFLQENPSDKPHFGDGFPFMPLNETCSAGGRNYRYSVRVGNASVDSTNATVPVTFAYPKACAVEPTVYTVSVIRSRGIWLIDDITFPDGMRLSTDLDRETY